MQNRWKFLNKIEENLKTFKFLNSKKKKIMIQSYLINNIEIKNIDEKVLN